MYHKNSKDPRISISYSLSLHHLLLLFLLSKLLNRRRWRGVPTQRTSCPPLTFHPQALDSIRSDISIMPPFTLFLSFSTVKFLFSIYISMYSYSIDFKDKQSQNLNHSTIHTTILLSGNIASIRVLIASPPNSYPISSIFPITQLKISLSFQLNNSSLGQFFFPLTYSIFQSLMFTL